MEHVQIGRTRTRTFGRLRNHLVRIALCLCALTAVARAEKSIVKDLNAQFGRTAAEIDLQPVWGAEGLTGARIGPAVKAGACQPVNTDGTNWAGWTTCVVHISSIPQFTPGMAAYTESRTYSTTTGGDRTITSPMGVGPDGRVYGGDTVTVPGPPVQTSSTTASVEHQGRPGFAYYRDLAIYFFFFGGNRTRVTGWVAYVRTRDSVVGPSQWSYVDSWKAQEDSHAKIKPVRADREKKHQDFWFLR